MLINLNVLWGCLNVCSGSQGRWGNNTGTGGLQESTWLCATVLSQGNLQQRECANQHGLTILISLTLFDDICPSLEKNDKETQSPNPRKAENLERQKQIYVRTLKMKTQSFRNMKSRSNHPKSFRCFCLWPAAHFPEFSGTKGKAVSSHFPVFPTNIYKGGTTMSALDRSDDHQISKRRTKGFKSLFQFCLTKTRKFGEGGIL